MNHQMKRRHFLKIVAAIPVLQVGCSHVSKTSGKRAATGHPGPRLRPGDPAWPSTAAFDRLKREVGGRLIEVRSPLAACRAAPNSADCSEFFRKLKNPYYIGDEPGLTQTSGWVLVITAFSRDSTCGWP